MQCPFVRYLCCPSISVVPSVLSVASLRVHTSEPYVTTLFTTIRIIDAFFIFLCNEKEYNIKYTYVCLVQGMGGLVKEMNKCNRFIGCVLILQRELCNDLNIHSKKANNCVALV